MSSTIVSTSNGKIKGRIVNLKVKDAKPVHAFRNIPFGKPPVGSLRFMPPQSAEPWTAVKDGTVAGNTPMYPLVIDEMMKPYIAIPDACKSKPVADEDCLHLSVYTPHLEKGKNLPVMVWWFGGGFSMGSERLYDGSMLAGMNDVVIVVPNYRLGIFGFLSLGPSSICPGNAGFLDQQLALRWVQENIDAFGGDKDNVTIFGESAGGMSVNMHLLSPLSRGLFHKAISHSGQATLKGFFQTVEKNSEKNEKCFKHLKIEEKEDCKILEALQKIPADDLVNSCMQLSMQRISFLPTLDGKVFCKTPEEYVNDKEFVKVPYILGCNSTEGQGILSSSSPNFMTGIKDVEEVYKSLFTPVTKEGFEKCKEFYSVDDQDELRFSKLQGSIMGDSMFVAPAVKVASSHSDAGAPTYVYHGNFQLKLFHDREYGPEVGLKPSWCICDHGEDVILTFGVPFSPNELPLGTKYAEEEKQMSIDFMKYLTNFAKTGNPNKGQKVDINWPQYKTKGKYLIVNIPYSIGENLAEKEAEFWNEVMPDYVIE
ncbi:pyrethroid hydrolase Ces2e-like isoform X1 [Styela clava]